MNTVCIDVPGFLHNLRYSQSVTPLTDSVHDRPWRTDGVPVPESQRQLKEVFSLHTLYSFYWIIPFY